MTQIEAFTQALVLAITAPSAAKAQMASELASSIAIGLTKKQINQCKKKVLELLGDA